VDFYLALSFLRKKKRPMRDFATRGNETASKKRLGTLHYFAQKKGRRKGASFIIDKVRQNKGQEDLSAGRNEKVARPIFIYGRKIKGRGEGERGRGVAGFPPEEDYFIISCRRAPERKLRTPPGEGSIARFLRS